MTSLGSAHAVPSQNKKRKERHKCCKMTSPQPFFSAVFHDASEAQVSRSFNLNLWPCACASALLRMVPVNLKRASCKPL